MLTRTERKKIRKARRLAEENDRKAKERRRSIGRWIAAPMVALGAVSTLLYFYPQFSLSKESPLDPSQPFSTPFVLQYTGWVPLYDLNVACVLTDVELTHHDQFTNLLMKSSNDHLRIAWHDDVMTFQCRAVGDVVSGDITIQISYHAPFLGNFTTERRYVSASQANGIVRWEEAPTHD
jgi:hypothetical protein